MDGLTAQVYEITVAIEHNPDGSVTICKELVQNILESEDVPTWAKDMVRSTHDSSLFGEPFTIRKVE
jgi:hypothetical protein